MSRKRPAKTLFVLAILLSATACQKTNYQVTNNDGPPLSATNIDASQIADAIPRKEPHSRYGNPSAYTVFGKRYHVLKTSRNYQKRGYASWYGRKFQGGRTSSGETYNMFTMTAANKELPIPTYVRVKNLENDREIIVKVNDRGPFHKNRIIDLSYVAAKKLGMMAQGTAYVEVTAIDPDQYNRTQHKPLKKVNLASIKLQSSIPKNPVYLQIGAFTQALNADQLAERIESLTPLTVQVKPETAANQQKPIYRVQIGPIADMSHTLKLEKLLKTHGIHNTMTVKI